MSHVPLHRHPQTPCPSIGTVTVLADRPSDDTLAFRYQLGGDVDAVYLPPRRRPGHADGLWRTTCVEAFIRTPGAAGYLELNFSPSGAWAVYGFDGYRTGMRTLAPVRPPGIVTRRRRHLLEVDCEVCLDTLGPDPDGALELGLAAVVQDQSGVLACWALAHPAADPDFHHPDSFALTFSPTTQPRG